MQKKIAIIVDGGYLSKIFQEKCSRHLQPDDVIKIAETIPTSDEEIFRIYFYNAPPFSGILSNPLSLREKDYSKTFVYEGTR